MLLASSNSDFLIPNGTFIAELIMFIIVLGIVAKFILPALTGAMDKRDETITSASRASDEGQDEADRLTKQAASVLEDARSQARATLEEAARTIDGALQDARQRGRIEHDRLLAQAQPGIEDERVRARNEVLTRFGALALDAAGRLIGTPIDATRHRGLLEEAMARAKSEVGKEES
jgi:F-type H+-transporting ATPase subunit b